MKVLFNLFLAHDNDFNFKNHSEEIFSTPSETIYNFPSQTSMLSDNAVIGETPRSSQIIYENESEERLNDENLSNDAQETLIESTEVDQTEIVEEQRDIIKSSSIENPEAIDEPETVIELKPADTTKDLIETKLSEKPEVDMEQVGSEKFKDFKESEITEKTESETTRETIPKNGNNIVEMTGSPQKNKDTNVFVKPSSVGLKPDVNSPIKKLSDDIFVESTLMDNSQIRFTDVSMCSQQLNLDDYPMEETEDTKEEINEKHKREKIGLL